MNVHESFDLKLRPHQIKAVEAIINSVRKEESRAIIHMTQGSGASFTLIIALKELLKNSEHKVLIVVDRKIVLEQFRLLIKENLFDKTEYVYVKTIQSLKNRPLELSSFSFVFSMNLAIKSLESLSEIRGSAPLYIMNNGVLLDQFKKFGNLIYNYSIKEAVQEKLVLPIKVILGNNYIESNREQQEAIYTRAVDYINNNGEAKFLITCESQIDAQQAFDYFSRAFGEDNTILYTSNTEDNAFKLRSFREFPSCRVIVVVDMLLTGFDMPALTDIVLLRRLSSNALMSAIARINRKHPNKSFGQVWDFGKNNFDIFEESLIHEVVELETIEGANYTNGNTNSSITLKRITPKGDQPAETDLLNRSKLVHILKGIIQSPSSFRPLNIGLFGRWGTGKSTVIELLKNAFKSNSKYQFITFNAWENEHCESMTASLANHISDSLYFKKSVLKRVWFVFLDKFWLRKDEWSYILLITFLVSISLFAFKDNTFSEKISALTQLNSLDSFTGYIAIISLMFGSFRAGFKKPLTQSLIKLVKNEKYKKSLGSAQELKESIETLINTYCYRLIKPNQEVVLIIDDLDRCSNDKILQTLEGVRLLINTSNVVVIYAVDKSTLLKAVSSKYDKEIGEQSIKTAREFLGKIFQLVVELEKPKKESFANFIYERLYKSADKESAIKDSSSAGRKDRQSSQVDPLSNEILTFDEAENYDYEDEEYIENDEYLEPSDNEAEFFSYYTGLFAIDNPRTLIRLHNTITFVKGLYPVITIDNGQFKAYVFFIFMYEYLCENHTNINEIMLQFTSLDGSKLPQDLSDIYRHFRIDFDQLMAQDLSVISYRVSRLSLPYKV